MNFNATMPKPGLKKARMKTLILLGMALLSLLAWPQLSLTDESIRTFTGHEDFVEPVAFSPDGCYALSGRGC